MKSVPHWKSKQTLKKVIKGSYNKHRVIHKQTSLVFMHHKRMF